VPASLHGSLSAEFPAASCAPCPSAIRTPTGGCSSPASRSRQHDDGARPRGGILALSAEEAALLGRSLREGLPRTSKLVTVSSKSLREPLTVETVLGAPVEHLLREAGLSVSAGDRILLGGAGRSRAVRPAGAGHARDRRLTILAADEVVHRGEHRA